jgi:hypothetical protein
MFWLISLSLIMMTRKTKAAGTYPNKTPNAPRGIRNNNPGNLEISSSRWRGKIYPSGDPRFEQFYKIEDGARAQMINIRTWFLRGKNTLRKLVETWAPATENNTQDYINFLSASLKVSPDHVFELTPDFWKRLAYFIAIQENGTGWVSLSLYDKAYELI